MVADRIEVTSRRAGASEAWVWRSSGGAGFEMAPASEEQAARVPRGTEVVLHLKADAKRYLERYEHRAHRAHLFRPHPVPDRAGRRQGRRPRQINAASALWQRPKSELKPEDYTQAYRSIAGAFDEPAMTLHYRAEGRQSYAVLLFVPSQRPFDLFDPGAQGAGEALRAARLHHRRCRPAAALSALRARRRRQRGPAAQHLARDAAEQSAGGADPQGRHRPRASASWRTSPARTPRSYDKIWEAFGRVLKEGLYEDHERRDQLLGALPASPRPTAAAPRSLKQYVADLKPNQTEIYYLVGESIERLKSNPKLEAARARGIEVLLLTDPVDAFWTSMPPGFEGKPLKSLSQGDVDFGLVPLLDDRPKPRPTTSRQADDDVHRRGGKDALGERVSDVRASQRLTDSAACLVASGRGRDRELERLLARQNRGSGAKPILELNMRHPIWCRRLSDAKLGARDARRGGPRGAAARPGADPRRRGAGRSGGLRQAA